MKLKRDKIRRSREQFIHYDELLFKLCFDNNMDYCVYLKPEKDKGIHGFKHMNHYICLYDKNTTSENYMIYKTRFYGSELNAYGDVIRWIERIIDNDR